MVKFIMKKMENSNLSNFNFNHRNTNDNKVINSFSEWNEKVFTNIAIIAGGTGITPIYRVKQKLMLDII